MSRDVLSGLSALAVQPDGRIVLAVGSTDPVTGGFGLGAMRLLPEGTLDPTFGNGGRALSPPLPGERISDLLIEPDGSIALAGDAAIADRRQLTLRRLAPDGAPDPTFGLAGQVMLAPAPGLSNQLEALVRWPDGSIGVVGVAFTDDSPGTPMVVATRLDPSGQVDAGFGSSPATAHS